MSKKNQTKRKRTFSKTGMDNHEKDDGIDNQVKRPKRETGSDDEPDILEIEKAVAQVVWLLLARWDPLSLRGKEIPTAPKSLLTLIQSHLMTLKPECGDKRGRNLRQRGGRKQSYRKTRERIGLNFNARSIKRIGP